MSRHSTEVSGAEYIGAPQNFVKDFLFGNSDIRYEGTCIRAQLVMDSRTEGWIGIPHGGIGMGAIMELAAMLHTHPVRDDHIYPLSADFRMGGSRARIGDSMDIRVSSGDGGAEGMVTVNQETSPYLSASIRYGKENRDGKEQFLSYMPKKFLDMGDTLIQLPHYRNCFVCGIERLHPGLKRSFSFVPQQGKIIISTAGFDAWDSDTYYLFRRNDTIHPIAFLALLDEVMGWGGFMISAHGGVTVRAHYTFYRAVHVGERIVVFGRGERVRGNIDTRLLFWASGGAAVLDDSGRLEPVIAASGQWLGVKELTDQMRRELIPEEQTTRVFSLAGA
jgi:hypothetical protein